MNYRHRLVIKYRRASKTRTFQVTAGAAAGVLIILCAVLLSVSIFGAYGWGLFVLTPFVVGITTGYLINRYEEQSSLVTARLVLLSAFVGCASLVLFALEGLICLIMAAPLAGVVAIGGGAVGRRIARAVKNPSAPLYCLALLPIMFAIDSAFPPSMNLLTEESIVIEAPAPSVWEAVTSAEPISEPATIAGRLGLAYPQRAELSGRQVGAIRIGHFSTGVAVEKITDWKENDLLGFVVLYQPPSMKEMSPYRDLHPPHVDGYFQTGETQFQLQSISKRRTRLTIRAAHRLQIDPIAYWLPIARWAASSNTRRVLRDLKTKAERRAV